jgi:D-serine deaminase-like pyridoxal phosphate-dependent protein
MSPALEIVRPTLVLDEAKVRRNIERMVDKARRSQVTLRPHCKTHQSAAIAGWFRDAGIDRITVSSLDMAAYFASHGWRDITVAFPCNVAQVDLLQKLSHEVDLGIVVDSVDTVSILARTLTRPVRVWIKIDVGYGRAGVHWADMDSMENIVRRLEPVTALQLTGVLTHAGHAYAASSHKHLQEISRSSLRRLRSVAAVVEDRADIRCLLSVGDTPTLGALDDVRGIDEIRPGNFVFHDIMQLTLGSCDVDDIAVAVAAPVVARYPHRREVLVHGGAAHLSKDFLEPPAVQRLPGLAAQQERLFGVVVDAPRDATGWGASIRPDAVLSRVSQEHGILKVDGPFWEQCRIGSPVYLLPVHSCLTADLYPAYMSLSGKRLERHRSNDATTGQTDSVI